ncbi:hypothetical protein ENSA5_50630 [Enhygromyxa salina]|uniref:Uncharacterized protein n=1 Tax=Enhygromyxa salina TaxID=215803 RepID=A0A2S9XH83_9BACT|nr:hypothetical protein [Enhygromyxa salina]PRP92215.1 hypothetical protein ENSA5_50630 [Enhygromyxa salina]
MSLSRRLIPVLLLPLVFACGVAEDDRNMPMFTTGDGSETNADGGTGEAGSDMGTGDGDGDSGDGDGEPGDGDGEPGDGDTGDGDTGDGDTGDGDCATDPAQVGSSCGQASAYHGTYAIGEVAADLPVGTITATDNGQGNGAEDWYQVDFPIDPDNPRPMAGMAVIEFATNDNNDYRFEVYRDCGAEAYGQGLAAEFGASSPPLTEWSFSDLAPNEEQLEYAENTLWPTTVWVRVFRFQNDGTCNNYQLAVSRN